jgi:hypothetical protein
MAGVSYILSREALKRFIKNKFISKNCITTDPVNEDLNMGICLKDDVIQVNTLDEFKRHRIFPVGVESMLATVRSSKYWIWDYTFYPLKWKFDCCSDTYIGQHYVSVYDQYLLNYLIYNVTVLLNNKYNHPPELPKKKSLQKILLDSIDVQF